MVDYPCVCDDLPPHEHEVVRETAEPFELSYTRRPVIRFRRTEHISRFWVDWRAVARALTLEQAGRPVAR